MICRNRALLRYLASFALISSIAIPSLADTYTVKSLASSGKDTLAEAIGKANGHGGRDSIIFAYQAEGATEKSSTITIKLTSPLPPITEEVDIDGFTQPPSYSEGTNPPVTVDGSALTEGVGLRIASNSSGIYTTSAPGSKIRGLQIVGFPDNGINITAAKTTIVRCFVTGTRGNNPNIPAGVPPGWQGAGIVLNTSPDRNYPNRCYIGGAAVKADRCVISNNRGSGVLIMNGNEHTIAGNMIGVNKDGTGALPNGESGIRVMGGYSNLIGDPELNDPDLSVPGSDSLRSRNVISGNNKYGVYIGTTDDTFVPNGLYYVTVQGNYIGTNAFTTAARGNVNDGIRVEQPEDSDVRPTRVRIGGTSPEARNILSGNLNNGITLRNCTDTIVSGNFIGLDNQGSGMIPNLGYGIYSVGGTNQVFGARVLLDDNLPGAANVISANGTSGSGLGGMLINDIGSTVRGNWIGTNFTSGEPQGRGNRGFGISLVRSFGVTVGGNDANGRNIVAFNLGDGVIVDGGGNNRIVGNRIYRNAGLGIDLGDNGLSANDAADADTGANGLQNWPVIETVTTDYNATVVTGKLSSKARQSYILEFFRNVPVTSDVYEGEIPIGTQQVTTGLDGTISFTATLPVVPVGQFLTATATDAYNNTSEFSLPIQAARKYGVDTVTLSPTFVVGGRGVTATVKLTQPARTGGAVVQLSSNSPVAIVPETVTVPEGALQATFAVGTDTVNNTTAARITATLNDVSGSADLTVLPVTGFKAVDTAVVGAEDARVLMVTATDFRIQKVTGGSVQIGKTYVLPTGWVPVAIGAGADGKSTVLLRNDSGYFELRVYDAGGLEESRAQFGRYSGFSALDLAVAADGSVRVLASNGSLVRLFIINGSAVTVGTAYTLPTDATPTAVAVGGNNVARILFQVTNGRFLFWTMNADGTRQFASSVYGPIAGWTAKDIAAASDGTVRILNTAGSRSRILKITGATLSTGGAYQADAGWAGTSIGAIGDKVMLLWSHTDGRFSLWRMGATGVAETFQTFGPY